MYPFGSGPVVRLVNRVRDQEGNPVPVEVFIGGAAMWIKDTLDMPIGMARIAIHQTMFRIDPVTNQAEYKLGCKELNAPEDPVPVEYTKRKELLDRDLLTPEARKKQYVSIYNPINYRVAAPQPGPRPGEDGALPGEFGERR